MTSPLVVQRTINAPCPKVFEAWTNSTIFDQWFFPKSTWTTSSEIDLKVGGAYSFTMTKDDGETFSQSGEFQIVEENQKLIFTWPTKFSQDDGTDEIEESVVTVEFSELDGVTEVKVIHQLLPTEDSKKEHEAGWNGCLDNLLLMI